MQKVMGMEMVLEMAKMARTWANVNISWMKQLKVETQICQNMIVYIVMALVMVMGVAAMIVIMESNMSLSLMVMVMVTVMAMVTVMMTM